MRLLCSGLVLLVTLLCVGRGAAWAESKPADERSCFRGLSLDGSSGLLDQPSANPGCAYRMRTASYLAGFVESGYLLVGDRFRSLSGAASVAATLGSHVELALQLGTQLSRLESPSLLSMSQLKLQMKLHTSVGKLLHLAVLPSLRLPGVGQDFALAPANLDGSLDVIGEVSLARVLPQVPLVLLGQLGYVQDRSLRALDAQDCMGGTVADCLKARLQSTAAYSVGLPRVRIAVGAQVALTLARSLWLLPQVGYRLSVVVGPPDPVLLALLGMQVPTAPLQGRLQQELSIGARLGFGLPLSLDVGVRIGLQSAGYAMGAKIPTVVGIGALNVEIDLLGGVGRAATEEEAKKPPAPSRDSACFVAGTVRDEQSGQPLADAIVRFVGQRHNAILTDGKGSFSSGELSCGAVVIESSRGDHQTTRLPVVVSVGEHAAVELRLPKQSRAQSGRLWLSVQTDDGSKATARATLSRGGQVVSLLSEEGGLFARAAAGVWLLRVEAAGYLSREQTVVLSDGGEQRLQLLLHRRSTSPKAQLGGREITLASPLTFATGSSSLGSDSERTLDEVVDLLIHHPELTLLRIEHQADLSQSDVTLLEQQAIVVRDYLVQHGISPERVVAAVVEGPRRMPAKIVLRLSSPGER